jgi:hypothetical protein
MKSIPKFLLFLISLFTFSGCHKPNPPVEFQIPINIENKDVYLSEYADSIYYVRLEPPDNFMMSDAIKAHFTQQYILIEDQITELLFLYHHDGRFITKIGGLGRGPSEYIELLGVSIDEAEGKIFAGDNPRRSIIIYNLQGQFLDRIQLDYYLGDLIVTPQRQLLIFTDRAFMNDPDVNPTIHIMDYEGNTIAKTTRNLPYPGNTNTVGKLYRYGDRIHIIPQANYMDSAFYVDDQHKIQPYFELLYDGRLDKSKNLNIDSILSLPVEQGIGVYSPAIETKNLVFLMQSSEDRIRRDLIFDKKTNKSYNVLKKTEKGFFSGMINDLDGGPAFYPFGQIDETWAYNILQFSEIINVDNKKHPADTVLLDQTAHQRMRDLFKQVKENDPVVLQIVRFKDLPDTLSLSK